MSHPLIPFVEDSFAEATLSRPLLEIGYLQIAIFWSVIFDLIFIPEMSGKNDPFCYKFLPGL